MASAQPAPAVTPTPAPPDPMDNPYEGRFVQRVRLVGLERVSERLVRNNIRASEGRPLEWAVVREDLRRLERLGEFREVRADIFVLEDGSVEVRYFLAEAPIVQDVVVVGNRELSDQLIGATVRDRAAILPGVAIDEFRIRAAQRVIEDLYRRRGFYRVEVAIDEAELADNGIVIFRIREGPRTQVTALRFRGNDNIPDSRLRPEINTKRRVLLFDAPLDEQIIDQDIAQIINFYRDNGYLDVRAAREIRISPNGREAIVTFFIEEGPLYTLRNVIVEPARADEPLRVYTPEQIRGLFPLKPGDIFKQVEVRRATETVRDAYLKMGYVDVLITRDELRAIDTPEVDLRLTVIEGERFRTGLVTIVGNELTKDKVIRRHVEVKPDEWLDGAGISESERRLRGLGLFELNPRRGNPPRITIQPENPANPGYRDVLVEINETNTGSLSFGAAVSSDSGVVGSINLRQRNFDLFDTPDSIEELITGRAFRGAGQNFGLTVAPGTEVSTYAVTLSEPYLFESPYGISSALQYTERVFNFYDEERFGGRVRLARRFGTRWVGGLSLRAESIDLSDIDNKAPVDVFEVEDQNTLTSIGFDLARTTVDSRFRPTRGTRTELGVEQVGALGGDFTFTKLTGSYQIFIPIDEDDFGRRTVLNLQTRVGYIPQSGEAPIYERLYLGGRSFRGFAFRGIGPRGVRNDTGQLGGDHVGGEWSFFLGAEVQRPLWQDVLAVVAFVDSGTLTNDVGFDDYRVAVGAGIRMYLPQFGQAPLAFDFAFPLVEQDRDDTQFFSFSVDIPF